MTVLLEVNLSVHRVLIGGVDESCSEPFFREFGAADIRLLSAVEWGTGECVESSRGSRLVDGAG